MATRQDIETAFRQSGIGRGPTESEMSFYSAYPDVGKVEGDIRAGGGGKSGFVSSGTPSGISSASPGAPQSTVDVTALAREMTRLQTEAAQPAIKTLEAGRQPLKERYDTLLKSIKERGAAETKTADILSARELGRRGIPTESTYAGEFQQEKRLPVQTAFGGLGAETELQGEQAQQAIANAIAQLQAGGGQNAINQALQLYQQQQQGLQSQEQLAQQLAQAQKEQAFKEQVFREVTLPESIYARGKPYYESKTTSGGNDPLGLL